MAADLLKKKAQLFGWGVLILSTLACNLVTAAVSVEPTQVPTQVIATTVAPATEAPTLTSTAVEPTFTLTLTQAKRTATKQPTRTLPTKTSAPPTKTQAVIRQSTLAEQPTAKSNFASDGDITVTAATGNLFIRRGPGTTYSIVSGLSKGVTTKAVGRNEKNDWLAIEIPFVKGAFGWISMGTGYTEMNGNISSLPLYPYDEPKPAYLQNCTEHDMTTRPGQWNLPGKTTQKVNPGEYVILDMYTGQNKVQEAILKEGNTISIKVDGDGLSYNCP